MNGSHLLWTTNPSTSVTYLGSSQNEYIYGSNPDTTTLYNTSITYTLSCPSVNKTATENFSRRATNIDCPPTAIYEYCPKDTAFFTLNAARNQILTGLEIKFPLGQKFELINASNTSFSFKSKAPILEGDYSYDILNYKVSYTLLLCNGQRKTKDTLIGITAKKNCAPSSIFNNFPIYYSGGEAGVLTCYKGVTTLEIKTTGQASMKIDSVKLYAKKGAMRILQIRKDSNNYFYKLVPHSFVDTISKNPLTFVDTMVKTIYYTMGVNRFVSKDSFLFKVRSCEPSFPPLSEIFPYCRGSLVQGVLQLANTISLCIRYL